MASIIYQTLFKYLLFTPLRRAGGGKKTLSSGCAPRKKLGTEPRTEHCDITDTVVKKMTTSAFGNRHQESKTLLNMANAGNNSNAGKYIASMIY